MIRVSLKIRRISVAPSKGGELSQRIASAQVRLHEKLSNLNIDSCGISEYNQRYLKDKIRRLRAALGEYGDLLFLSMAESSKSPESFVLAEYGGGHGVLSFLAKEIGIGTVIYNDIYDVSCRDASRLSGLLKLPLDHVVCGDVDKFISYLNDRSIPIDALASYDVLEHIYDIESHF